MHAINLFLDLSKTKIPDVIYFLEVTIYDDVLLFLIDFNVSHSPSLCLSAQ